MESRLPLRKCLGCWSKKFKKDLIRIVKTSKENDFVIIEDGKHCDGRGAYVCKSYECFQKLKKLRRLERAFSCKIDQSIYDKLESMVK